MRRVYTGDGDYDEEEFDARSSVKLTRNAKGDTQIEVHIFNADPKLAEAQTSEVYDRLCEKYGPKPESA
jgi:hypothetical protein